jgi:5'-3' exonuclease
VEESLIALIDADVVLHRVGYTTDNDEFWVAKARTDDMLDSIIGATDAAEYELWLSDARDRTFRFELFDRYKANRTAPRPVHYDAIKEHLIKEWGARIALGMEADDALGIAQDKGGTETVICSIDKDLMQIPGQHYNFVKEAWDCVTKWEGLRWFYKQLLIGDISDNVEGCKGIGPIKAGKALDQISEEAGEKSLFCGVFDLYKKQYKDSTEEKILDHILLSGRLLKIKQVEDESLWEIPVQSTEDCGTQKIRESTKSL